MEICVRILLMCCGQDFQHLVALLQHASSESKDMDRNRVREGFAQQRVELFGSYGNDSDRKI
jgi:hypothetical protein